MNIHICHVQHITFIIWRPGMTLGGIEGWRTLEPFVPADSLPPVKTKQSSTPAFPPEDPSWQRRCRLHACRTMSQNELWTLSMLGCMLVSLSNGPKWSPTPVEKFSECQEDNLHGVPYASVSGACGRGFRSHLCSYIAAICAAYVQFIQRNPSRAPGAGLSFAELFFFQVSELSWPCAQTSRTLPNEQFHVGFLFKPFQNRLLVLAHAHSTSDFSTMSKTSIYIYIYICINVYMNIHIYIYIYMYIYIYTYTWVYTR